MEEKGFYSSKQVSFAARIKIHTISPNLACRKIAARSRVSSRDKSKGGILLAVIVILLVIGSFAQVLSESTGAILKDRAALQQSVQAHYAAEAGLIFAQAELELDGDCSAYSVTSNANFNGIDYVVSVTPENGSPVTITASVDLGTGASKSFSKEVTMYQDMPDLLLTPSADAYIDESNNGTNYETNVNLLLKNPEEEEFIRSVLQFDLSTLIVPANLIESIKLELYFHAISSGDAGESPETFSVYAIEEEWTEDEVSWNKRTNGDNWTDEGGVFNSTEAAQTDVDPDTFGWYSWDLTTLTKNWLAATTSNYGVLIKNIAVNHRNFKFYSKDSSQTALRPVLRLKYKCECGQVCS